MSLPAVQSASLAQTRAAIRQFSVALRGTHENWLVKTVFEDRHHQVRHLRHRMSRCRGFAAVPIARGGFPMEDGRVSSWIAYPAMMLILLR
jgi:hypothetical protein